MLIELANVRCMYACEKIFKCNCSNMSMWMDANVSMWMDPCVMVVMYVPSAAQSICAQFCDVAYAIDRKSVV